MSSIQNVLIPSTFFFPLSTNVGYFDSTEGYLTLTERVKQASLLYEKLVFESGVYIATIWEDGNTDMWMPPEDINDEMLAKMRSDFKPVGGDAFFSIADPESGELLHVTSGPVVRRFHCEFHSTLRALNAEHSPWIEIESFELTPGGKQNANLLKTSIEKDFDELMPDAGHFLKTKVLTNLSQDLVLSSAMQVAASVDAVYAPLLRRNSGLQPAPGFAALQVALPNLSHLSWDKIVELRNRDCLVEFRQKMVSLEAMAKEALPQGEAQEVQYQFSLFQTFIQELTRELAERQPSVGGVVGNVALDLMIGLIPIPGVSAAATGIRGVAEVKESNQSWTAAFLQLRNPQ